MDIKNNLYIRKERYKDHNHLGDNKYDYGKNGIMRLSLPKILFKGNSIFVTFLQLIDLEFIMLFKTIERLKKYKHITSYM